MRTPPCQSFKGGREPLYLVSLLTPGNRACEGLLLPSVHAHGAEDGFRADGALCGPRLVAVRLLEIHLLLIILAACRARAQHRVSRGSRVGSNTGKGSAGAPSFQDRTGEMDSTPPWKRAKTSSRPSASPKQLSRNLNLMLWKGARKALG